MKIYTINVTDPRYPNAPIWIEVIANSYKDATSIINSEHPEYEVDDYEEDDSKNIRRGVISIFNPYEY